MNQSLLATAIYNFCFRPWQPLLKTSPWNVSHFKKYVYNDDDDDDDDDDEGRPISRSYITPDFIPEEFAKKDFEQDF